MYDLNHDGQIEVSELTHMIRHIRRMKNESVEQEDVSMSLRICNVQCFHLFFFKVEKQLQEEIKNLALVDGKLVLYPFLCQLFVVNRMIFVFF